MSVVYYSAVSAVYHAKDLHMECVFLRDLVSIYTVDKTIPQQERSKK